MGRLVLFLLLAAAGHKKHKVKHVPPAAAAAVDLTGWEKTHPEAVQSLGEWVQANPTAAKAVLEWDERSRKTVKNSAALLAWTLQVEHGESAEFMAAHADWKDFAPIVQSESLGIDRLIRWCRDHPKAAAELESSDAPLAWLGKNAYQEQLKALPASLP